MQLKVLVGAGVAIMVIVMLLAAVAALRYDEPPRCTKGGIAAIATSCDSSDHRELGPYDAMP